MEYPLVNQTPFQNKCNKLTLNPKLGTTSRIAELLLIQLPPASKHTKNGSDSCGGNADGKDDMQTLDVAINDNRLLVERERLTNISSTRQDQISLADLRSHVGDILDHLVDEGRLSGRNDVSATKTLEDCEQNH